MFASAEASSPRRRGALMYVDECTEARIFQTVFFPFSTHASKVGGTEP
jgi:hypothetical protein